MRVTYPGVSKFVMFHVLPNNDGCIIARFKEMPTLKQFEESFLWC